MWSEGGCGAAVRAQALAFQVLPMPGSGFRRAPLRFFASVSICDEAALASADCVLPMLDRAFAIEREVTA